MTGQSVAHRQEPSPIDRRLRIEPPVVPVDDGFVTVLAGLARESTPVAAHRPARARLKIVAIAAGVALTTGSVAYAAGGLGPRTVAPASTGDGHRTPSGEQRDVPTPTESPDHDEADAEAPAHHGRDAGRHHHDPTPASSEQRPGSGTGQVAGGASGGDDSDQGSADRNRDGADDRADDGGDDGGDSAGGAHRSGRPSDDGSEPDPGDDDAPESSTTSGGGSGHGGDAPSGTTDEPDPDDAG